MSDTSRRRFLTVAGSTTIVALAGCSGLGNDDTDSMEEDSMGNESMTESSMEEDSMGNESMTESSMEEDSMGNETTTESSMEDNSTDDDG